MVIAERQFDMLAEQYKLSPRQKEIVRYLLGGVLTDREIAKRMRTAGGTVDKQLLRICTKMHARTGPASSMVTLTGAPAALL